MEFLILLAVTAAVVASGVVLRKLYRERFLDPAHARSWFDAQDLVRRRPDLVLLEVVKNYERGRHGTKSYVRRVNSGKIQDTWFWEKEWSVGQFLVVAPSVGWGPHNRNPDTLYVRPSDVALRVPASAVKAATRVERRERRASAPG